VILDLSVVRGSVSTGIGYHQAPLPYLWIGISDHYEVKGLYLEIGLNRRFQSLGRILKIESFEAGDRNRRPF